MRAARFRIATGRADALAFVAGAVFCVSGMAKSLDAARFADVLARYGDPLRAAAPVLILVEAGVGLGLTLGYRVRRMAAAGAVLTLLLTAGYLYGVLFRDVGDCGCFGRIEALNTSLPGTLVRNAILGLLLAAGAFGGSDRRIAGRSARLLFVGAMCLTAFVEGYTLRGGAASARMRPMRPEPLAETPLSRFAAVSADSTYLFFAFSYTCPHCLNSIENLNRYEAAGVADRVVAFALADEAAERRFRREFEPRFEIRSRPADELSALTDVFPSAWYVRGDSVVLRLTGELPAACLLRDALGLPGAAPPGE